MREAFPKRVAACRLERCIKKGKNDPKSGFADRDGCELSKPRWGGEAVKRRKRQGREKPRRASGTPSTGFSSASHNAPHGQAQK